jgi:actin related protein 2/3 complex subunit 3
LSTKQFACPGEPGWPLGGLFSSPANKAEGGIILFVPFNINNVPSTFNLDLFKAYFKQAREELCVRLCDRLFDADGTKNKWWQVR